MATTIEPTTQRAPAPDDDRGNRRALVGAIVGLAVLCLALGALLIAERRDDDREAASMPDDVLTVLDDFEIAVETHDYDLMQRIVTDSFRRPMYEGDPFGGPAYRAVQDLQYFDFFEDEAPLFEVERLGEPIVQGDGPWYVSYAETWPYPSQGVEYESIYTYVVIDVDGEKLIDDAYWVGHSVVMEVDAP